MSVIDELPKYIDNNKIQWTSPSGPKTFKIGDCIQLNLEDGKQQMGTVQGFYDDEFSYTESYSRNAHPIQQNGIPLVRPNEIAIDFKGSPYFRRLSLVNKDNRDTVISNCEITSKRGKKYIIPNVESTSTSGQFGHRPWWMPTWLQGGRKTRQKYRIRNKPRKSKTVKRLHRRM